MSEKRRAIKTAFSLTKQDSQHWKHQEMNSWSCHIKKKQTGPATSREHRQTCHTKGALPARYRDYLPFVLQKETFVCDTEGSDIVGDAQKGVSVVWHLSQTTGRAPCACHPARYLLAAHLAADLTLHSSPAPHCNHSHWGDPVID